MSRLLSAVVCPLEPLAVGTEFPRAEWPLHATLLGNFEWLGERDELIARVGRVVDDRRPVTAEVGDTAMFGPEKTIPVNVLVPSPALRALHEELIDERMRFAEPQFLRAGYEPHITHFPAGRRHAGDVVRLQEVVLAEMIGSSASICAVWEWR